MAGRAGGQIFRDVLRRKMNAETNSPNYDDQGQEMSWDEMGYSSKTKQMRNPNSDGTFDGPSGGRPMYSPDKNGQTGQPDPDKGRRARLMERAKAQGAPFGYGYEDADEDNLQENDALERYINEEDKKRGMGGGLDADQIRAYEEDFEAEDRMDREAGRLTGPELAKIQGRLLKAGETADGGDMAIVDAISAEAERMGAEGVPLEDLLSLAGSLADPYSTGDEKQTRAMLQQAYQRGAGKAQNQMNKNMGKPFR